MPLEENLVPHIYDVPDPRTDLLHFDVYRDKLCQLILQYLKRVHEAGDGEDSASASPARHAFVIGIHGPWGCGKSTLMEMVGNRLSDDRYRRIRGLRPPVNLRFQAWKYNQREELWRALLSRVVMKAERVIRAEQRRG